VKVSTEVKFTSMSAGMSSTCGVTQSGDVYCWGGLQSFVPAKVELGKPIKAVSVGSGRCYLDTEGVATCTLAAPADQRFKEISVGRSAYCGITVQGELFCWGIFPWAPNGFGSSTAVQFASPVPLKSLSTGFGHMCAIGEDLKAYCIGNGNDGQLGDGAAHSTTVKAQVAVIPGTASLTDFSAIAAGFGFTCGLSKAGAPACWGLGARTGTGGTGNLYSPAPLAPII
jgi:alpha-tubulin suppressor-like RCC1 family protein